MGSLKDFKQKPLLITVGQDEELEVEFLLDPKDFYYSVEHSSPENWRKSARCTYEPESDSGCYACEQGLFKWNQKVRVYMPILVNGNVCYFAQGTGRNSLINTDIPALLREHGTLLNKRFLLKRVGAGKRTKYSLELVDILEKSSYNRRVKMSPIVQDIRYQEQKDFYEN